MHRPRRNPFARLLTRPGTRHTSFLHLTTSEQWGRILFSFTETEDFFGTRPAEDPQKTRRRRRRRRTIASKYTPTNNNTATTTTTLGSLYIFTFAYSHTIIKHSEYQHPYYYTQHDEVFLLCAPLCVVFFSLKCLCQMPDASLSFYWRPTGALPSIES